MSPSPIERRCREPRLWVFNLDAELELQSAGPYQTSKQVARALEPTLVHARRLLAPGDEELTLSTLIGESTPRTGRCWCPSPTALKRLVRAGAEPEPSPDVEILRRVNHRRFALVLGGGAPGSRYVESASDLDATLREANVESWLCKRPLGFAGRGQRRVPRSPSRDDQRWLQDSLGQGGFLAEPWLQLTRQLCLHGQLDRSGGVELGHVCTQRTDATRSWVASELVPPGDLEPSHERTLLARGEEVAAALFAAGYFGPFGIDAYLWQSTDGERLNPLGEINARYSMGFAVGMQHVLSVI